MLQIIKKINTYYTSKNRWWLPLLAGIPFSLCLPPFNHEFNPAFSLFPFLSFVSLLPLFYFATRKPVGRAMLHTFLYSYTVGLGLVFWLTFVTIKGLWVLILLGMVLLAAFVAFFFLLAGYIFRCSVNRFPLWYIIFFPACWILIDYVRSLGEMSFPWGFLGYIFTPLLPLCQLASVTGIWGLTFIIVFGNVLVWDLLIRAFHGENYKKYSMRIILFFGMLVVVACWGWWRMNRKADAPTADIAIVQPALDQINWGRHSIDTAFSVNESLVVTASHAKPDLIVGPESALLCFLSRQSRYRKQVLRWADRTGIPIILGSLHWDKPPEGSVYDFHVFNTAFLVQPHTPELIPYRKIKLVPFSEAFPFEGIFPILSRVNLGESDFQRGKELTVFTISDSIRAAPFICYESIYPDFVRDRLRKNANLIVHITNDGWFGRTTGPYQHATMARMRVIENRVAMARCANTGISMFVDPFGRVLRQTKLYKKDIIREQLPLLHAETLYSRFGDWFVLLCFVIVFSTILFIIVSKFLPDSSEKS